MKKKRIIAFITALAESMTIGAVPVSAVNVNYGDLNDDNLVNIADYISLKAACSGENEIEFNQTSADVYKDENLNIADLYQFECYLFGGTDSILCEPEKDSDNDGVADYLEKNLFGTNTGKADTDNDGISDYNEVYITHTDPLKNSSSYLKEDTDNDGLSNGDELQLKTDPECADSDRDGLSDYEEVKKYKTDPVSYDTDGDLLSDKEETVMGTDPLNEMTDGKNSDSERVILQKINSGNAALADINKRNKSDYKMSVEVKASGFAEKNLKVSLSSHTEALMNDYVLGDMIDVDYLEGKVENIQLSFEMNVDDPERYCICKYYDDAALMLPVETEYEGSVLKYSDTECGSYCILDAERWINDCKEEKRVFSEAMDNTYAYAGEVSGAYMASENQGTDIYFFKYFPNDSPWFPSDSTYVDTECQDYLSVDQQGHYHEYMYYKDTRKVINSFMGDINTMLDIGHTKGKDLHIYGVDEVGHVCYAVDPETGAGTPYVCFGSSSSDIVNTARNYVESVGIERELNDYKITDSVIHTIVRKPWSLAGAIWSDTEMNFSDSSYKPFSDLINVNNGRKKYVVILDNGSCPSCVNAESAVNELKDKGVNVSFYYYPGDPLASRYKELASDEAAYVWNENTFAFDILNRILDIPYSDDLMEDCYMKKMGLKKTLSYSEIAEFLNKNRDPSFDVSEDTDGDGLSDLQEVRCISTLGVLMDECEGSSVWFRNQYCGGETDDTVIDRKSVIWNSDPCRTDTDGDSIIDSKDPFPDSKFDNRFVLYDSLNAYDVELEKRISSECMKNYANAMAFYGSEKPENAFLNGSGFAMSRLLYLVPAAGALVCLPFASMNLTRFLNNDPNLFTCRVDEMERFVINTRAQRNNYYKHMNLYMNTVESMLLPGSSDTIAVNSSLAKDIGGTDYSCDIVTHKERGFVFSEDEMDAFLGVGGGCCNTICSKVSYDSSSGMYVANVKYCLYDSYDWDGEPTFFEMQKAGYGRPFITCGEYEFELKWKKGSRYEIDDNVMQTQLHKRDFRKLGIEDELRKSDEYEVGVSFVATAPLRDVFPQLYHLNLDSISDSMPA